MNNPFDVKNRKDESFEMKCAKKLKANLSKNEMLTFTPKMALWSEDFSDLCKYRKQDQIEKVLDWYCCHMKDAYVPQAYTSSQFCEKFPQIEAACNESPLPSEAISDEANDIVKWTTQEQDWPNDILPLLPSIAQKSLNAYTPFYQWLTTTLKEKLPVSIKQGGVITVEIGSDDQLLNHLLDVGFFRSPRNFVLYVWLKGLYQLGAYKGNPNYMVWSAKSKSFEKLGIAWTEQYTSQPGRWNRLAKHWE